MKSLDEYRIYPAKPAFTKQLREYLGELKKNLKSIANGIQKWSPLLTLCTIFISS